MGDPKPVEPGLSEQEKLLKSKYQEGLERGIALGKKWNEWADESPAREEEGITARVEAYEDSMDAAMAERVALLKEIEHLKNIGEVSSGVKTFVARVNAVEKMRRDIQDEMRRNPSRTGELSKELSRIPYPDRLVLSREELDEFKAKRWELAQENGYEVVGEDEETHRWALKKDDIYFSILQFLAPSDDGIGKSSRISKLGVWMNAISESEEELTHLQYDRQWEIACEDPRVQKEIDRLVAIFG